MKQIIQVGCESIVADPMSDHPEMQREAIELFCEAFEKFAIKETRRKRSKTIEKALKRELRRLKRGLKEAVWVARRMSAWAGSC